MIAVTISPDVAPEVYDILAMCLAHAVESAQSGVRTMDVLGNDQGAAHYEEAAALLAAMQRQLGRKGVK